jgi:hypothetical protein
MLSKSDKIAAVAEKVSIHFFITMLNPKYRGPRFNFKDFDIGGRVEGISALSFAEDLSDSEKEDLRRVARSTWDGMLERSDVCRWISSQIDET